mmetsp:Transcript_24937/g.69851  ORF Transcript_24937/g.69851 Transcript_24937/m.69851 type:complete len:266 (-) Transcript_24937:313-1110(-)
MFHSLVGNLPAVWGIRADPRIRKVFEAAYSHLRGYDCTDFYCSMDGMTVHPPIGPFADEISTDWAHLDQSSYDAPFWCIQGQVVLNNSTACFRASPKSHLVYTDLLRASNVKDSSSKNWCLFRQAQYDNVRKAIEDAGGAFQVPIRAERGSVILWLSSTVHSAIMHEFPKQKRKPEKLDPYPDWRFVVYTCYRPKDDCFGDHRGRMIQCLKENRTTNHSGQKIFPKRNAKAKPRSKALDAIHENPAKMYDILPLTITPEIEKLTS